MFKKFAFLLAPILLGIPFEASVVELSKESSMNIAFAAEERGEYNGYTYTEEGITRVYDTTELTPKIVKNFWAPTGYKFTLNISDDQINEILDQTEGAGNNYAWISLTLSYHKFGMEIEIEQFNEEPLNRENCFNYIKNEINNYHSFYELENVQVGTELSVDLSVFFYGSPSSHTFIFHGEEETIHPVDGSTFIDTKVTYLDGLFSSKSIQISAVPAEGFFYQYSDYNEFGFHTETTTPIEDGSEDFYADYTMKIYAYESVEIDDATKGFVEVTYPSHPLPLKAKMEFVAEGGERYTFWSKEFTIGDPDFNMSVDGFDDRDSVQMNTIHDYAIKFNRFNNEEFTYLNASAKISPVRIRSGEKFVEYYDLAVEPTAASDFYLYGEVSDFSNCNDLYSFSKLDATHYVLRNVPLLQYCDYYVWNNSTKQAYYNHSEYEGCHYHIEADDVTYVDQDGVYDVYLDTNSSTDNSFSLTYISPITPADNYYLNVSGRDPIKMTAGDLKKTEQYLYGVTLNAGDIISVSDGGTNTIVNTSTWECCGFTINDDGKMVVTESGKYDIQFHVYSSRGMNIVLKTRPLPEVGTEGYIYYIASRDEVLLHHQGKDDEFLDKPFGGQYIEWKAQTNTYINYDGITLFNFNSDDYTGSESLISQAHAAIKIDFAGEWNISFNIYATSKESEYGCIKDEQKLQVTARDQSQDYIVLTSSRSNEVLPDDVNLLNGGEELDIIPSVPSSERGVKYYHSYEVEKEGIVEIIEKENGVISLKTLKTGLTNITFYVECELFPTISKTISIRVLDTIFDVAKIEVPDEFHYAGKDLTAAINIRGFTRIQNIDVDWKVVDKSGKEYPKDKIVARKDATMTMVNPDSSDYTITAFYQDIQRDTLTVQIRYVDMNSFLKLHIWWVIALTLGFVALVIFLSTIIRRGKTTVQHIERVYDVYCQCMSNNTLSLDELKRIRRELKKCLGRCEDLNIDAFNQYEKATRYLRKSLADTDAMIKKYGTFTQEERDILSTLLDKDLSKALNVAKEIEAAKDLIEAYHVKANKQNYEFIKPEKKNKNKGS